MRKVRFVPTVLGILALVITACAGSGDDGEAEGADAAAIDVPDETEPVADPAVTTTAENLSKGCNDQSPCPGEGESCIVLDFDDNDEADTGAFCTIPCSGPMDQTTCATGFPGPGQPLCAVSDPQMTTTLCAVICNAEQAPDCPEGATCIIVPGQEPLGVCAPAPEAEAEAEDPSEDQPS
jgi:hypothetical protein